MDRKVLVVDDEDHIRMLIEQTLEDLEDEGIELLFANNGEDALNLIKAEKPELVLLDVMMPRMNGMDVCRHVKSDQNLKETHIIILTAKGQEMDKQKGVEVGANQYMTKPFDPDELLETVEGILQLS